MSTRVIWKFTLNPWDPWVTMPAGARVLCAREQSGKVRIWAEVDPDAPRVERRFHAGMTGSAVPPGTYVGSASVNEDGLEVVVHVYDTGGGRAAA